MSTTREKKQSGHYVAGQFDTRISTIEKQYGIKLGVRGDMKLGNYLKAKGYPSLAKMFQR